MFLDRARAKSALGRVSGAVGLPGRVAAVQRDNTTMYELVVGAFADRASAERRAGGLVVSGAIDEARVVSRTVHNP